jgi:hypothetical protein
MRKQKISRPICRKSEWDYYRMGTRANARKRDVGPKILALAFFKGAPSLFTKKLVSINPALFWESRGAWESTAFAGFNALRRSEPNAPKQSGAFFQLKYTYYFQAAK